MKVELRNIDDSNRTECLSLKVTQEQLEYVATYEESLNDINENVDIVRPFAIYIDEKIVGFTLLVFEENHEDPLDRYWLWRLMIDVSFQGKGYGLLVIKEIINYFRENNANVITLSTKESNTRALSLYRKCGFKENGQMNGEEIVLKLQL